MYNMPCNLKYQVVNITDFVHMCALFLYMIITLFIMRFVWQLCYVSLLAGQQNVIQKDA